MAGWEVLLLLKESHSLAGSGDPMCECGPGKWGMLVTTLVLECWWLCPSVDGA